MKPGYDKTMNDEEYFDQENQFFHLTTTIIPIILLALLQLIIRPHPAVFTTVLGNKLILFLCFTKS